MVGVLEGIRVIDVAQAWAGPGVSMYLGDQGAEVIKVEPLWGDEARRWGNTPYLGNNSGSFMVVNRNKRGIAVDLTQPEGKEIYHRLAATADVVIENFRPGVADRMGIGYDALAARNPRIIYASISAYGTQGPYATKPGYDSIIQGLSGAMGSRTLPDGTPQRVPVFIADCSVPIIVAYGITLALLARARTGRGQRVESSLLQAALAMQSVQVFKVAQDPTPEPEGAAASYGVYQCSDGQYINVAALTERMFTSLLNVLDLSDVLEQPDYQGSFNRAQLQRELYPVFMEIFKTRPAAEWLELLMDADIPCGPILARRDLFTEPQVLANGMVTTLEHPEAGPVQMMHIPLQLSAHPGAITRPAPVLGQHTEEVLRELGYGDATIEELRASKVILA